MNQKINNIFKGDKVIWMVFFFLCMISIIEVFSASSNLTYKSNNYIKPIMMHSSTIIAGVVVAILTLNIPCRYFKLMTPFLLFFSVFTLLLVLVAGEDINGAQRVIAIFGLTFQPSEIAKYAVVFVLAHVIVKMGKEIKKIGVLTSGPQRIQMDIDPHHSYGWADHAREPLYGGTPLLGHLPHDVYWSGAHDTVGQTAWSGTGNRHSLLCLHNDCRTRHQKRTGKVKCH